MRRSQLGFCLATALSAINSGTAIADSSGGSGIENGTLTIASWNIANLAAPGSILRGFQRSAHDYRVIGSIVAGQSADVFAFQEIGSIPALEAVLPDGYSYRFESRCYENSFQCQKDDGRIYTAIAVRKDIDHAFFDIDELSVVHLDECGRSRNVRGAVGVSVSFGQRRFLIPSLHMKATCRNNSIEPGTQDDCLTQHRQYMALREWVDGRGDDESIVLAGDFNRDLYDSGDHIRQRFFSDFSENDFLPRARVCWTKRYIDFKSLSRIAERKFPQFRRERARPWVFSPRKLSYVDYFVVKNIPPEYSLDSVQHGMEGLYNMPGISGALKNCDGTLRKFSANDNRVMVFAESHPSDHCPITLTVSKN